MPRIHKYGALAKCRDCGYRWETLAKNPQCPKCRSWHIDIDEKLESVVPFFFFLLLWRLDKIEMKLLDIEKVLKKGGEKSG